ncbi:MAG TPA: sigma-54-dependent Fis family transcriptional regulator, partial [Thermodesulfobacteriaceae bacterium]|nr:sigma-54-dependent Fis family transcriptional regulator [Thermodesulfobacteriaceae bacterium]
MKERILIVDDDPNIRDGSSQVLSRAGYDVSEASTGAEALSLVDRFEFDLILLDLKMPDVNGLDLLRNIRENDQQVPVVMITAYGTIQNAVEAMRLGADDFLPKPFEPDELRMVVSRILKARRLTLENQDLKEELRRKE